ncbi:MAG: 50S ribosomal protein L3 [Nitrospirae bacterium CG_4_9_14_3_um_filter_51_5]|nr:MAG: 50S ribosomal protein L3 [Nitrospirae bacterium CG_4_9_14_3_um_filter_51_5]
MVKGLIGKKLGMIQVFDEGRRLIPVTVIEAGPCGIVQIKKNSTDGYESVQIGFREIPERKMTKPQLGHLKKAGNKVWRHLREFASEGEEDVGSLVDVNIFSEGESINVQGVSKGKGFQGVIKRHNYAGGPASHGSMFHRAPGSIGASSFPSRVLKNKKLPGHMGNKKITVRGLKVFGIKSEENIILVSGSIPGPVGGIVIVRKVG